MSFLIEGKVGGEQSITPRDFAETVVRTWSETGFVPVEWPEGGVAS